MSKDELKTELAVIKEYLLRVKPRMYPLSKDYEWIESAVRIISEIVQRIPTDQEVKLDGTDRKALV